MQDLKVTVLQTSLFWEDPAKNLEHFDRKLSLYTVDTDLIILPEMFTTGFTMAAGTFAEPMDGNSVGWMSNMAQSKDAVVTGSLIINAGDKFVNRLIWARPDGSVEYYDKRHLFRLAKEEETYSGGTDRPVFQWRDWRICPQVCYDLRFPVWSRNREDYELLFYVANWPERRNYAWKNLLVARAIENQAYVIGVNRVGKDGKDISYSGDSAIIDYKGEYLYQCDPGEDLATVRLSASKLLEFKESYPFFRDADPFKIT